MTAARSSAFALLGTFLIVSCTSAFVPPNHVSPRHFGVVTSRHAMDDESAAVGEPVVAEEDSKPAVKCPNCDLCDGSGRILGGIGVILDWWPIKAYRPCPNFIDSGGRYVRSGQGLDEIAFGRDSTFNPNDL
eukprot:CAMPEP_0113546094 /NCGR_PEP_ID=MMETSP0015_2-20120614/11619_1 /TAXON_ID=2838 /ORGANISM="Odontella" /LENGTH=131 /DNA_ID=CAMNT_0000446519 /DNA_START=57 /DNA_END=452 /DNA_ORIENTATION=+ /assembly_acc=CAM_ASM_000160